MLVCYQFWLCLCEMSDMAYNSSFNTSLIWSFSSLFEQQTIAALKLEQRAPIMVVSWQVKRSLNWFERTNERTKNQLKWLNNYQCLSCYYSFIVIVLAVDKMAQFSTFAWAFHCGWWRWGKILPKSVICVHAAHIESENGLFMYTALMEAVYNLMQMLYTNNTGKGKRKILQSMDCPQQSINLFTSLPLFLYCHPRTCMARCRCFLVGSR